MKKVLFFLAAVALFGSSYAENKLIVAFATTHLNGNVEAVSGVVVSPSGIETRTLPMGPFEHSNIVFDSPEIGTYNTYFVVHNVGSFRLCHIVGGVVAHMSSDFAPIELSPKEAHIQNFPFGKQLEIGTRSCPIGTFEVTEEDITGL